VKVTGSHRLEAPRETVWDALQDPAVLARTLPGCEALEVTGDDAYAATLNAGVASVKGTYRGQVRLLDKQAPASYRLYAEGAGAPGTVRADAFVTLEEDGNATIIRYEADAVVGGMIGGVGQRMLCGVAKKTAGEFFSAVEADVLGVAPAAAAEPSGAAPEVGTVTAAAPGAAPSAAAPQVGQVFRGAPSAAAADRRVVELLLAAGVGAAIALAGVLVGRRLAGRS
jgi:uncharacterized protein